MDRTKKCTVCSVGLHGCVHGRAWHRRAQVCAQACIDVYRLVKVCTGVCHRLRCVQACIDVNRLACVCVQSCVAQACAGVRRSVCHRHRCAQACIDVNRLAWVCVCVCAGVRGKDMCRCACKTQAQACTGFYFCTHIHIHPYTHRFGQPVSLTELT